jgi:tetratricopeptide (TPR) repeat protein
MKVKESLGHVLNDLADQQSEEGHDELARPNYDMAQELAQQLLQMKPGDIDFQRELARCYSRHGDLAWNAGKWEQAANAYRASFDIYDRLLRQYPDNIKVQHSWIAGANNVALSDEKLNRLDEALDLYTRVGQREARAVSLDSGNNMVLRDQEVSYSNLTRVMLRLNRLIAAEDACRHELEIARRLWSQNQQSAEAIDDLSGPEEQLAEIESKRHHYTAAVANEKQALDLLHENLRNSGSAASLVGVIDGLVRLGNYEMDLALGTPSAKDVSLKAVFKNVGELHQLETRLGQGNAEYNQRTGSIHALEERLGKLRQQ